jgi:hypothetical protein
MRVNYRLIVRPSDLFKEIKINSEMVKSEMIMLTRRENTNVTDTDVVVS